MGEVVEFKPKSFKYGIQTKPTPEELARHGHMIEDGTWQWEYNVNIFFRYTDTSASEEQAKQCIHKHFPMTKTEDDDDNNTNAYQTVIYTPEDYEIERVNHVLDKLDGDWELCLHMPYFVDMDFDEDRSQFVDFVNDIPDGLQWQALTYWVNIGDPPEDDRPSNDNA